MPDPKKKIVKAPNLNQYQGATKVDSVPQGFNQKETIPINNGGTRTYYDQNAPTAISGGNAGDAWKQSMIKMLQNGISPDELVKQGHISPSAVSQFSQYYKPIYTETNPISSVPKTTSFQPVKDQYNGIQEIFNGSKSYRTLRHPDPTASGYSGNAFIDRHYSTIPGFQDQEIDINKVKDVKDLENPINILTGKKRSDYENISLKDSGTGETMPLQKINNVPVTEILPTKILTNEQKTGTKGGNALQGGYKKGGLINKMRGYYDGGDIIPSKTYNTSISDPQLMGSGQITPTAANGLLPQNNTSAPSTKSMSGNAIGAAANTIGDLSSMYGNYVEANSFNPGSRPSASNIEEAGAFKGAGKGISMGASLGSAIAPGVGTLIGAGVGAIGGGLAGYFGGKQSAAKIDKAYDTGQANAANYKTNTLWNANANNQLQQRGFKKGGLIGKYSNGGEINGKGTPKSDSINAKIEPGSFVVPAEHADKAKELKKMIIPSARKTANLNQSNGEKVKLSNGEFLFTPEEKMKLQNKGVNLNQLAPDAKNEMGYKDGGEIKKKLQKASSDYQEAVFNKQKNPNVYSDSFVKEKKDALDAVTNEYRQSLSKTKVPIVPSVSGQKLANYSSVQTNTDPLNNQTTKSQPVLNSAQILNPMQQKGRGLVNKIKADYLNPITSTIPPSKEPDIQPQSQSQVPSTINNVAPSKSNSPKKLGNIFETGRGLVSNLANYALPYAQTQMGLKYLNQAGARPVGQIDQGFQGSVNKANVAAGYGFSPEEETYLNNQNLSALEAGKNAARNYSGGSAGNAYNMERDAANQFFGRGLQTKYASKNLQLEKQQMANEMNLQKANMSRQLFQDNLNGWQQNQQSGAQLLNAGISNAIGSKMYADEINNAKERNGISNSWLNI